jgi:hypothetical protein
MTCPSCRTRKSRRVCPALQARICPVCCGTKRLVEIACPADCSYLASSRSHPPAPVLKRRERDLRFLVPVVQGLSERAYHLLMMLQGGINQHRHSAIPSIDDADVAEAAATLASTYETAARGIIYEHQARSIPAQRLATTLRELVQQVQARAGVTSSVERDAAQALRRVEQAAKAARAELEPSATAYLQLLERLPRELAEKAGGGPDVRPGSHEAFGSPPAAEDPKLVLP